MDTRKTKSYLRKVKDNYFVIGDNVLKPLVVIDGKRIIVDSLEVGGTNLTVDGAAVAGNTAWSEAFELDADGDLTPVESNSISDPIWILYPNNNLELRVNHWRYALGSPNDFTEDVSF